MADFKKLIDNKAESAQYMIDGITDVIKTCGKRGPGSEGEKKSCEFMADANAPTWSRSRSILIPSSAG